MRTAAEVMTLVTKGRRDGTLTQRQAAWVLDVWSHDESQPERMTCPGGWRGMMYIDDGTGSGGWYVRYNRNRTVGFKTADCFSGRPTG